MNRKATLVVLLAALTGGAACGRAQAATQPSHAQSKPSVASQVTASVTPDLESTLPGGDQTPAALAGDLVPSTGVVTTDKVPTPKDSAVAESYDPPSVGGTQFITALAVSGAATVALAVHDASQVVVFQGGQFATWSLPTHTIAKDVAYLNDGTLGVTLSDCDTHYTDHVATFTTGGNRHESATVIVSNLVSAGSTFVTVGKNITVLDADAEIVTSVPLLATAQSIGTASARSMGMRPGGNVVMASEDGVMTANPSTGQTQDTRVTFGPCLPCAASIPVGTTLSPAGSTSCPQIPILMTTDGAGDVWLTLPQSQNDTLVLEPRGRVRSAQR